MQGQLILVFVVGAVCAVVGSTVVYLAAKIQARRAETKLAGLFLPTGK